jgi:serine protease inhibitor ecotin
MLNAAKHPRNNRYHNAPSLLEDVTWDRYTFKLPVVLSNPATVHPSVKDRFYRATLEGISAAHQASSLTKTMSYPPASTSPT